MLIVSMVLMIVTAPLVYVAPNLELAFVACVGFCLDIGLGITALITVLMARYAPLRGAVMGLNATGQNVGVVVGTIISSIALGVGGYPALAVTLSAISLLALGIFPLARRILGTVADF
jgi:MFS transporter, DHA1 family, inner membrane transport protein